MLHADLTLTAGSATNGFFNGTGVNSPRVWNGTINYTVGGAAVCTPEPGALAVLAPVLPMAGLMLRRRKRV